MNISTSPEPRPKRVSEPSHAHRRQRIDQLAGLISSEKTAPERCLSTSQLLERMGDAYGDTDRKARLRLLQLDLEHLCREARIEAVNPGGRPLRYRRCGYEEAKRRDAWSQALGSIRDLIDEVERDPQLTRLWERLLYSPDSPVLAADRLRVVPDTLRLQPPLLYSQVLRDALNALAYGYVLQVNYRNREGKASSPQLHPQALILRGPIPYLLALKNDEDQPVRFYALHRMTDTRILDEVVARQADDFDLDKAAQLGILDFGRGELIELELRVGGYIADLLESCALGMGQSLQDEPDGSAFTYRVTTTVPSTGQLLRWLLAAGPNVEVLAPADLRQKVAWQTWYAAFLYDEDEDEEDA